MANWRLCTVHGLGKIIHFNGVIIGRKDMWPLWWPLRDKSDTRGVSEMSSPWWSNLLPGTIRGTKTSLISCVLKSGYVPCCREVLLRLTEKKKNSSHTGRHRWYYHILIFLSISLQCSSNWIHSYNVETWCFIIYLWGITCTHFVLQADICYSEHVISQH